MRFISLFLPLSLFVCVCVCVCVSVRECFKGLIRKRAKGVEECMGLHINAYDCWRSGFMIGRVYVGAYQCVCVCDVWKSDKSCFIIAQWIAVISPSESSHDGSCEMGTLYSYDISGITKEKVKVWSLLFFSSVFLIFVCVLGTGFSQC